ncbi:hypothetical protein SAMN05443550_102392 [Pedobacter hartonius]|uniref:Uncharacterized protein n=1 Tax=Pedobacter hartonius TaxID=425514 RepID=A0A1H3ZL77_9SPHI|nr:hypothetical protein SAMN05443550_102392 [Pedobacter hartonius]
MCPYPSPNGPGLARELDNWVGWDDPVDKVLNSEKTLLNLNYPFRKTRYNLPWYQLFLGVPISGLL